MTVDKKLRLRLELIAARGGYRTGFNGRGFIRELADDELPVAPPPSPSAKPTMPTLFDLADDDAA